MESKPSLAQKLKNLVIGHAHSLHDQRLFHKLSLIAFFAWVGLGADGLSSSSYGPEETFLALQGNVYLGIFVALLSALTILIISASYSQIIELFPSGGGGYVVATKLLSPFFGMISGSALIIDYVLTIAISIAAGAAALFSFLPAEWHSYRILVALIGVIILTLLNLRGVKESVAPLVPIFLAFIITHVFIILYAIVAHLMDFSQLTASATSSVAGTYAEIGLFGIIAIILYSYSMGAGTYTGIEAVSNALPILRKPRVKTAKRTMRYMAVSLAFVVVGLIIAYLLYDVAPESGKTLNAVLFESVAGSWSYGYVFVLVALVSEAALLFVAAQTGFFGGPRVLANMALDRCLPSRFANLSDRFVTRNGVLLMGCSAFAMVLLTNGSVRFLVVVYSITVFITFVLSQLGMVRYCWKFHKRLKHWRRRIVVNGTGLILTSFILASIIMLRFYDGGWIALLITGALIGMVIFIKRHYNYVAQLIKRLDYLAQKAESSQVIVPKITQQKLDPKAKTAVILVRGFNGLGIHTLQKVTSAFGGVFKNFVFVEIGAIDAGIFKHSREIENLKAQTKSEVEHYVDIMKRHGYYAEGFTAIGIDVVDEVAKMAPAILKRFPHSVFFGGQMVLPKDSLLSRLLHNYTVFAVQRRLYQEGKTVVVLPVEV